MEIHAKERLRKIRYRSCLDENDIRDLFNDTVSCVVVKNYFSQTSAQRATKWLTSNTHPMPWGIGDRGEIDSDMCYSLGLPRQIAMKDPGKTELYLKKSNEFLPAIQRAFGCSFTPFHKLLKDLFGPSLEPPRVSSYNGKNGALGIVRHMSPRASTEPADSFCHIDSSPDKRLLSANLYLSTPPKGGPS